MAQIAKQLFLTTLTCPTYGWLQQSGILQQPLSTAEELRIEEGLEVHDRARNLFPDGIMVSGNNGTTVQATQELLSDQNTTSVFEATFIHQNYITKADILLRDNSSWKIIEVKSNVNDKQELIDDLAYTTFVAQSAGLQISTCSLFLINKDYRLGMPDKNLFVEIDHTAEVLNRVNEYRECSDEIVQILSSSEKPTPLLRWECKGCDIFDDCCGEGIENHIFDLPRLHHTKFCQLRDRDIVRIEDIPEDFDLTNTQSRVRQAVLSGDTVVDSDGLKNALNLMVDPVFYLDFETVQTCIPLYPDIAPYQQISTQYSLHICSKTGEVVDHKEYLADPGRDCRRELAENLIKDCGSEGSIVVYTHFEKTIIGGLAKLFPDLEKDLMRLIGRLVDLCKILKNNYYHQGFHGSFSIKKVLPVLVEGLGYEGMEVDNGLDASALFAFMCRGRYIEEEVDRMRENLLEYCGMDTEAMVRLHEKLNEIF